MGLGRVSRIKNVRRENEVMEMGIRVDEGSSLTWLLTHFLLVTVELYIGNESRIGVRIAILSIPKN